MSRDNTIGILTIAGFTGARWWNHRSKASFSLGTQRRYLVSEAI